MGHSPSTERLLRIIQRIAPSSATVLITGETGTGKDVVARAIHEESGRNGYHALAVTEISEGLFEAELFGHERGAFTGALTSRPGLFEQADGGTLFLDEIGDAPPSLQAKLLRVVETYEIRRVGGTSVRRARPRLICATNRNLANGDGRFREDLLYRLEEIAIHLLPLRQRPEDLEPLTWTLLDQLAADAGLPLPDLTPGFLHQLACQPWPGNARELRSVLQRVMLWWDGERTLTETELAGALPPGSSRLSRDEKVLRERMLEAYAHAAGNQEAARRELEMTRGAWRHRWARFGLECLGRGRR